MQELVDMVSDLQVVSTDLLHELDFLLLCLLLISNCWDFHEEHVVDLLDFDIGGIDWLLLLRDGLLDETLVCNCTHCLCISLFLTIIGFVKVITPR